MNVLKRIFTSILFLGMLIYGNAASARFVGADPHPFDEANVQSFNLYAYGNNNPYRYRDPDGKSAFDIIFLAVDVGRLGYAVYTGAGVGSALIDVGMSTAGVLIPIPGMGEAMKAARAVEHTAEAVRGAGHAAEAVAAKTAEERAQQLHSLLDSRAQRARTTAVTETEEGTRVVSSSERRLSRAQRNALSKDEVEGVGEGHAEVTGVNAAKKMGLTPTGTAASRPICPDCAAHLEGSGVDPLSPLK